MKRLILGISVAMLSTAVVTTVNAQLASHKVSNQPLISQSNATVISSGNFQPAEHPTTGAVRLVRENDQHYIEFDSDFQTDSGPDLYVILHRSANVVGMAEPPAYSLKEENYLAIAPLQNVSGAQRYLIPEAVDLSEYQSVAVWCRQFNATFGAASLGS